MWQRGPGEGFHAAKDDALHLDPTLRCQRSHYDGWRMYVVLRDGKVIGSGNQARDAWAAALDYLREQAQAAGEDER